MFMDQFETTVKGVTCICEVDFYYPGSNYAINSASLEPNDDPEFQFTLNNHKGQPINWLNHNISDEDSERIFEEFLDHAKEYESDYSYH